MFCAYYLLRELASDSMNLFPVIDIVVTYDCVSDYAI